MKRQMMELLGSGAEAEKALGLALVYEAVAEEGLGQRERASWSWNLAAQVYPGFREIPDTLVGEPVNALRERTHECLPNAASEGAGPGIPEPPRVRMKPKPGYTAGASKLEIEGQLVVRMIVGADGRPRCPVVLQSLPAPSLTVQVLESVYKWEFEPASINGTAVDAFYHLTTDFRGRR
ncbi:MAG: energy transducer TonB [Acidobacteriota bacterium]|nr:energy transducer TonB [Acidobacteriota bacterium]MDH3524901.1 energy transducer TonB [Acidobacteriota bacterium]